MHTAPSTLNTRTIRGAIRVTISTSRDALIAGDHFSVFVKVQNPFEVPLRILDVSAFVPVEFFDVERRRQDNLALRAQVTGRLGRAWRFLRDHAGASLAQELNLERGRLGSVSARPIVGARYAGEQPRESSQSGILQPGNTTTEVFTLSTRHERTFRPGSYRMQISVRYRFEDQDVGAEEVTDSGAQTGVRDESSDVIEYVLDVRSSLSSILIGGTLGSVAGWLAANLSRWGTLGFLAGFAQLLVHVMITWGLLLLFARKKDVQPLLSVEDAYGAALIGFMVGFSGGETVAGMLKFPVTEGA